MEQRKRISIVLGIVTILLIVLAANYARRGNEPNAGATPTPSPTIEPTVFPTPYRLTLSGTFVCLPHRDTSGPQTLECAFGLKTDDGKYYALDMNLSSQYIPQLKDGQRFSASGTFTPVEMLSSDHWRIYPIVGIFSVTDSVKLE